MMLGVVAASVAGVRRKRNEEEEEEAKKQKTKTDPGRIRTFKDLCSKAAMSLKTTPHP